MTECKEPFMMPLSQFLHTKKASVIKFIEDISNVSEFVSQTKPVEDESQVQQMEHSTCKYLAVLHRILSSCVPQMKVYISKSQKQQNAKLANAGAEFSSDLKDTFEDLTVCGDDENDLEFVNSMERLIKILSDLSNRVR
jgi:hypothetical protein